MPITMDYNQWKKRTYSPTKRRSASLKAVDEAVRIRHEPAAKKALEQWIQEHNRQNKDWHRSCRNSDGAVETLCQQVGLMGAIAYKNPGQEMADKSAKKFLREEQLLAKKKMFTGKKVAFKSSFFGVTKRKSDSKLHTLKASAQTVHGVGKKANEAKGIAKNIVTIIEAITGNLEPETASEVIKAVFGQSAADFALEAAPIIGVVTSGGKMVMGWVDVARTVASKSDMESRAVVIRKGDPSAAFSSILLIIDRDIKRQAADATIHSVAFTAKGIGVLADGGAATGQVVGAIESIASLLNLLVDVAIDAKQVSDGNKLLQAENFDITMFNECPILGCYYIVIQDDSTIMDFDIDNMGRDNWQLEAQRLKIAIRPVIQKASNLIKNSRIEIPGMESAKGVYQASLLNKIKVFYKSKGYGLSTQEPDIIEAVVKGDI